MNQDPSVQHINPKLLPHPEYDQFPDGTVLLLPSEMRNDAFAKRSPMSAFVIVNHPNILNAVEMGWTGYWLRQIEHLWIKGTTENSQFYNYAAYLYATSRCGSIVKPWGHEESIQTLPHEWFNYYGLIIEPFMVEILNSKYFKEIEFDHIEKIKYTERKYSSPTLTKLIDKLTFKPKQFGSFEHFLANNEELKENEVHFNLFKFPKHVIEKLSKTKIAKNMVKTNKIDMHKYVNDDMKDDDEDDLMIRNDFEPFLKKLKNRFGVQRKSSQNKKNSQSNPKKKKKKTKPVKTAKKQNNKEKKEKEKMKISIQRKKNKRS